MRTLNKSERKELEACTRSQTIESRAAIRARIILEYVDGRKVREISEMVGITPKQIYMWIDRYEGSGLEGLNTIKRPGRPAKNGISAKNKLVKKVCSRPPKGHSRWTVRSLSNALKLSKSFVHRTLKENKLFPHRLSTFMYSPDPQFEDKLLEVVGLYMNPPENAVVLCVDEKTGIQALDRTQPILPLRSKHPKAWTNEYVRHGTRTLLAALEINTGKVTAWVNKTRKSIDFVTFMNMVAQTYPNQRLYVVMDNLNIHKGKHIKDWLAQHPLITFHFTPTHASWVNLIECFFSILTRRGLQQAVHRSTKELENFLKTFIAEYNKQCGPFTWTKGPDKLKNIIQLTHDFQKQVV